MMSLMTPTSFRSSPAARPTRSSSPYGNIKVASPTIQTSKVLYYQRQDAHVSIVVVDAPLLIAISPIVTKYAAVIAFVALTSRTRA